ncbi:hypothetical protein ACRRTK_021128 [Alexandromys fortis]
MQSLSLLEETLTLRTQSTVPDKVLRNTTVEKVCKLLSMELQEELNRTGRSREVLEMGQVLDTGKRKRHVLYRLSETRLEEALEDLCKQILDYSVHAEHKGSVRFAKGQSQTMSTLTRPGTEGSESGSGDPPGAVERAQCVASETAYIQKTWTGKKKISDGHEEEEEEKKEEEEEEITKASGNSKHDPEDL